MTDNNKNNDWFEQEAADEKERQKALAQEFAEIYLVFVDTPRAKEVLEFWERQFVNQVTPVESSIQRYAADEAVRDFVRGIRRQINLAQELRE